jgi:4-carboxymuconolactone decarboxylase
MTSTSIADELDTKASPQPLRRLPQYAKDNGVTEEELIEASSHRAFYAGWPKAFSAITVVQRIFRGDNT